MIRGSSELNAQFARYPDAFTILVHGVTNLLQRESPSPAAEIAMIDAIDRGTRSAPSKAERDQRNLQMALRQRAGLGEIDQQRPGVPEDRRPVRHHPRLVLERAIGGHLVPQRPEFGRQIVLGLDRHA